MAESPIQKVLIYRLGSIGDTVVALPCFHLIERTFPCAERVLLTNVPVHSKAAPSAAVLDNSGLVQGYMRYTAGTRSIRELLRLAWKIRRFRPDVLVYMIAGRPLKSVCRDRWFFRLAGVRSFVGFPCQDESKRLYAGDGLYESEASRLARCLSDLGDTRPGDLANWSLRLTAAEREKAVSALGPLCGRPMIVCGIGTKMQSKDWGQDNWRALLTALHTRYPGYGLALIGALEDTEVSDYAAREWAGLKVNLCGKVSLRESAGVLEHATVFLGPDSGQMHMAACFGVPCVIAFSARVLPGVWYPTGNETRHQVIYHQTSCFGCKLETCTAQARRCLTSIAVAEMVAAVDKVLDMTDSSLTPAWMEPVGVHLNEGEPAAIQNLAYLVEDKQNNPRQHQ